MILWINFGTSEIVLRSFSIICGVLSIIFIFLIARYLFNNKIALLSAFLLSINSYNIMFSQEARNYTLMVLLGLISVYYFLKSLKENKTIYWIIYSVSTVLGIYNHTFAIFILFFQWIFFILLIKKHKKLIKNFILSQLLILIIYLPWIPHFHYANLYAAKYFWLDILNYIDLPSTLVVFGIGQTLIRKQSSLYLILPVLLLFFFGFIIPFLIGIFPTKLRKIKDIFNGKIEKELFLALYLFIPIITPFILSMLSRPIFLWKYVMVGTPAFYILISRGIFRIKKQHIQFIFLFIIILLSSFSLFYYYSTPIFKGDWREAANHIEKNEMPGDLILVHSPQVIDTLKYYYKGNLPITGFPDLPIEKLNPKTIRVTEENIGNIDSVIKDYKRVWLIQRLIKGEEQTIPDYLDEKYERLYFNKFVWVRIYLYQLKL